jgi:hypothetical protein
MTYGCPALEFEADTHLMNLQHLQIRVLHAIGNLQTCISIRDMQVTFQIYITKLYRKQLQVIHIHEHANVRNILQGEARHRKYKGLKLGVVYAYNGSSDQIAVVA